MRLKFSSTLLVLCSLSSAGPMTWLTGKVIDAKTGETARDAQWVIAAPEYSYVLAEAPPKNVNIAHSDTNPVVAAMRNKSNRQHCRLIVGDSVKYSQNKGTLYVVDADGKRCAFDILRQERLTQ